MVTTLTEEDMLLLAKAERYCANEEQCKTSVRKKLCDWGVSVDLSNKIVNKLVEQGFIDERRYARAYCASKLRHQKWGRLKVIYQLRSKQIPPKFITDALLEIPDELVVQIGGDREILNWCEIIQIECHLILLLLDRSVGRIENDLRVVDRAVERVHAFRERIEVEHIDVYIVL